MAKGKKTSGKPIPKGHKLAKGGKRPGSGLTTRKQREVKKLAAEMVIAYLKSCFELATGRTVRRFDKKLLYTMDAAAVRRFIGNILPVLTGKRDEKRDSKPPRNHREQRTMR